MIVGIDLGTTNSAIAYINDDDQPEIIVNRDGDRVTPSVILFEDNEPIVGSEAKANSVSDPDNVIQYVKRSLGNKAYKYISDEGTEYSSEELSALILKRMKEDAEDYLAKEVTQAVITVPAYFNDAQRKATQDAGKIAGLDVLKVINEPTAAAFAYGIGKVDTNQNIMVYDLGGGTFDVTIMSVTSEDITIKATGGDKNLGGFDFDNKIIKHIENIFEDEHDIDLFDDSEAFQDLREKAEACKKSLSKRAKAKITVTSQGKTVKTEITKDAYDEMIKNLIDRSGLIMDMVQEESGLEYKDIDKILLVGGSTRMPQIQELIERKVGIEPSLDVNPDEVVAIGAAYQAKLLENEAEGRKSSFKRNIQDVNSHSLGIISLNEEGIEVNSIILNKNTPIPCEEKREFFTVNDSQTEILLQVTEGEDEEVEYVNVIGDVLLKLKDRPKESPIEVSMGYDENSIVHVSVTDVVDGTNLGEMEIKRQSNLTDEEVASKANRLKNIDVE